VAVARALNIRSAPQTGWTAWARRTLPQLAFERPKNHTFPRFTITDLVGQLLDRHKRFDAVLTRQVNIVGAKPAPGAFHRLTDMLGRLSRSTPSSLLDRLVRAITNHGAR
jgi:hypothetical protein